MPGLTFTAKLGQPIKIGDDVVVTVVRQKGPGAVQINVEAPASVKINRLPEGSTADGESVECRQHATH